MVVKMEQVKVKEAQDSMEVFAHAAVPKAALNNAMLAILMVLVYNLADTFYIG